MHKELNLLVVSAKSENRKFLLGVLHGLPINVYSASTLEQAQEVLFNQQIALVFCEGRLPDGSYRELLLVVLAEHTATRFVVVLSEEEWAEERDARKLGVSYVLRCPLQPMDVELVLIRVVRGELERVGLVEAS